MNAESLKPSTDWVRWLETLALPGWARRTIGVIMLMVLHSTIGLLTWASQRGKTKAPLTNATSLDSTWEVNVKKTNLLAWILYRRRASTGNTFQASQRYKSCFFDAHHGEHGHA